MSVRWSKPILIGSALAVVHAGAGLAFAGHPSLRQAAFWAPSGIAVAGLWVFGIGYWPALVLGTVLQRLLLGYPIPAIPLPAVGTVLEAVVAVLLFRRLRLNPSFDRLRDVGVLALAVSVAPLGSAAVGLLNFSLANGPPSSPLDFFTGWWRMNALGMLLVIPFLLTWRYGPRPRPTRRDLLETLFLAVTIVAPMWYLLRFGLESDVGVLLTFVMLAPVLYAAVRFGPRGAATVAVGLSALMLYQAANGLGVFGGEAAGIRHLTLQAFVLFCTAVPLMLGTVVAERERVLAEQVKSDAMRRAFEDMLPDVSYLVSADGRYLDMTVPAGVEPTFSRDEIIGRRVEDIVPGLAPDFLARIQDALAGRPSPPIEYEIHSHGRRHLREARFVKVSPDEVLCPVRDITERKETEALLGWSAEMLELIVRGRPTEAVLTELARGIERLCDGGLCSVLLLQGTRVHLAAAPSLPAEYNAAIEGLEIGPSVGSCGTAAYHGRTVIVSDIATDPLWDNYRGVALAHGLRACWSVPVRATTGAILGTFAIYYREPRSPSPNELLLVGRAANLAGIAVGRAQHLAALREHELLLDSINRNVNEGLYRSTPDRGLVYVNNAMARMFGYESPESMLRVPSPILYQDPGRREELKCAVQEHGQVLNEEVCFLKRDGAPFWGLVSSTGVRDATGEVRYYDGAVTDITARKELEERLRQAQKMEAVGKLAGGVAHDFNNLLTAIGGYAFTLIESLEPGSTAREDAEEIRQAANRAASLTRQLLAYSRQQMLAPQVHDLGEVVEQLGGLLGRLIGEDIRLVSERSPEPCAVMVDRGQVEQVILNLAVNARDAMPEGGTLRIETGPVELGPEAARALVDADPGSYVCLRVWDTGVGMDDVTRSRAFDPFFTTKGPGKGTGLGLSTVYGIVRQSGGGITLDSAPGAGTTVRIYFPRVVPVTSDADRKPESGPRPGSEVGRVLVAEDEQMVRDLIQRTLTRAGFTALTAVDGAAALTLAEGELDTLDLLVTDVIMPRLGGRDLAARLRLARPGLPVLFVSGYSPAVSRLQEALEPGTAYLQKPFTPSILVERVRELLSQTPAAG
jgi:PAS domain S-box-containing protein